MSDFYISKGSWGEETLYVRKWSNECKDILQRRKLPVVLNQARGWKPQSLKFLKGLEIERLSILTHGEPVRGLEYLKTIKGLKSLSLDCHPQKSFDFSALKDLEKVWLSWSKHYESIFNITKLKKLGISEFPYEDLKKLAKLTRLEELTIVEGKLKSLSGLSLFGKGLQKLELCALRYLTNIDEIVVAQKLRYLNLSGCKKINSIDPLSALSNLVYLNISELGDIPSLRPLEGLNNLEVLDFTGSTNILDGDLKFLKSLPKLKHIAYDPRKHYNNLGLFGKLLCKFLFS